MLRPGSRKVKNMIDRAEVGAEASGVVGSRGDTEMTLYNLVITRKGQAPIVWESYTNLQKAWAELNRIQALINSKSKAFKDWSRVDLCYSTVKK